MRKMSGRSKYQRFLHKVVMSLCMISITISPLVTLASGREESVKVPATNPVATFTDWRQEAQAYNNAMQLISQAANIPLRREIDIRRAISLLQKAAPAIEKGRVSAAIQTAADNPTFQNSVKAALGRRCGATRDVKALVSCVSGFINELPRDRTRFSEAGGLTGLSLIQTRLRTDSNLLRRAGENLNLAIRNLSPRREKAVNLFDNRDFTESRVRTHHPAPTVRDRSSDNLLIKPTPVLPQTGIIEIPVAIAMTVCALGGTLTGGAGWAACAAGAVIIAVVVVAVAWAALKSEDFFVTKPRSVVVTNPDTNQQVVTTEQKTDYEVCKEQADKDRETCLRSRDFWIASGCWATWALKMADCLLLPQ